MLIREPSRIKVPLLLFVLVMLVFAPITYHYAYAKVEADFNQHMQWAIALAQNGLGGISPDVLAHAGWQIALVLTNKLFHSSFEFAGFLVALFSTGLTALILFFWYQPVLSKTNWPSWKTVLVILGVCIAAPVSLLWPLDRLMYLGYIGITSYHNPTSILLKPFAILQLIFAYQCFREAGVVNNWQILLGTLISAVCTFIKPSLAICILPALAVFSTYRILKREYLNYKALFWGLGLPTVIVLVWQFALTYSASQTDAIVFLPFVVMREYSDYLGWKLLLSILFPLALLIAFFHQAIRDTRMILAWLIFLIGIILTYFFAESGPHMMDGNFGWSAEIASLLLFVVSTLFYFEESAKTTKSAKLLTMLWSLHVVFGVLYYVRNIFAGTYR